MLAGGLAEENLEQRIERIRKRDEEIEKKHREAEADRLAALQANAMVKTSAPNDDDWPKAHKYDTIDFTYDVNTDGNDDKERHLDDFVRPQRPFKKFADGEGPPADPSYNFLADSERDGKVKTSPNEYNRKDMRNSNNNPSPSPSSSSSTNSNFNRQTKSRNSFNRDKSNNKGNMAGKEKHYDDSRKNDRDRSNDMFIQRQKSIEGSWRQEAKDQKSFANDRNRFDERQNKYKNDGKGAAVNGGFNKSARNTTIQQRLGQNPKAKDDNLSAKIADLAIEVRGNATISVNKDGEVKSVKLESAKSIGSGRVGSPRHSTQQPTQRPLFQQTQRPPQQAQQAHQESVNQLAQDQPDQHQSVHHQSAHHQSAQQPVHQQPAQQPIQQLAHKPVQKISLEIDNKPLAPKIQEFVASAEFESYQPLPAAPQIVNGATFKLPSIQERLKKNRVYFDENMKNQPANEKSN